MTTVTSAWRLPDFRRIWTAGAFSSLGAEVGELAVPVLALVTLGATASELSFVRVALLAPYLLLTLWLGVVVDRLPRRPLMIAADFGRGMLLLGVCVCAVLGWLTIPVLIAASALLGSLTVLYVIADFSLLPLVVDEPRLIDANARITAAQSAIGVAGAGVGGVLVQVLTAPFALAVNAAGYLVSGVLITRVRVREAARPRAQRASAVSEAKAGLLALARHRVLRALVGEAALWNLGNEVLMLALSLLLLQDREYGPLVLGAVLMTLGVGAFVGSLLSRRLTARFGYGRSLVAALIVGNTAPLAGILAINTPGPVGLAALAGAFLLSGVGIGIANSQATSVRQLSVESAMRGRVNAGYRLVSWGALSIGALLGGVLVTALGVWPAAVVGAAIMAIASVPVAVSPVAGMRTLDDAAHA
ncbi:MFS transporter [Microbacterium sp. P05]|uniref:MFS transporter n=1 Tax=Microbacterium sp. P05 TaxID=3366948 RepID=UPI0037454300